MRVTTSMTMLVAGALALAACGGKGSSPPIANSGGGSAPPVPPVSTVPGLRDGALWSCQISDYDPQPCRVSRVDGGWELRKLMGSQRFVGALEPAGPALRFTGRFFCPWGSCDSTMDVTFTGEDGAYVGTFDGDGVRVWYDAGMEAEYGGAGYGGLTGEETD